MPGLSEPLAAWQLHPAVTSIKLALVARVRVTLLGGFAAVVDGVEVEDGAWRLRKARELVKLLALAPGHRLHREQLMDVLWGDRPPAAAANNLHQAVHVARRALGAPAIEVRDEMIRLDADVDVDAFEAAAATARRAAAPGAYRMALTLYEGELLPENRYDDWVEGRRDRLAGLAAELTDELVGIDAADATRPLTLPADATSFVGRERELAELKVLVRRARLLTLAGAGGVGKTRLVLQLARAAESWYSSGVTLVDLAALTDPDLIPDAIAAALDVRALPGESLLEAVVAHVAPRSLLLVLDTCEHLLVGSGEVVSALLGAAPALTILATSREPLRIPGEVVFRVPSLEIPDPERTTEPRDLLGYEAVRLFVERARDAALGFALDEHNAADVARICFRLDGLPLAIELAAARMEAFGPAAIAERLDDRFRVLQVGSQAAPTRQRTLTATLEWSHDLLAHTEQTLFRRLAVFAGGFDLSAVERVCPGGELRPADITDALGRLVEKSLVAADDGSSRERRYRLLETVRLYARERLEAAGESAAVTERHAAWALALAQQERGSVRLDRDASNLRAALDTLGQKAAADALRLCVALSPFWMRRIELHEAQRRLEACLAACRDRSAVRAEALLAAAAIEFRRGTVGPGRRHAEESHAISLEIGDVPAQWRALQFLGEIALASDAADIAKPWLERGLELARSEAFAAAEATCVYSLGVAAWMLGDLAQADDLVQRSIELFEVLAGSRERIPSLVNFAETARAAGRPGLRVVFEDTLQPFLEISCDAAVGYALANLSGLARARADPARARMLLDRSAAVFENLNDQPGIAAVLVRRAYLELAEGATSRAREALARALELRREQNDRRGSGVALAGLGLVDTTAGNYRAADRHLTEARELFRRAGDRWGLASTLWRIADLALARQRIDDAEAALQEARTVLGPTQRERWVANTLAGLAEVALLRGAADEAEMLLAEARRRYLSRHDALGAADVDQRLREIAKDALSPGKEPAPTTLRPS